MQFHNTEADIFVPDRLEPEAALSRTTMLSIAAHQDDCEIMAYHAIQECYDNPDQWFTAVVLTDGGGSPRSGAYANCTNHEIHLQRSQEQRDAAAVGQYAAVVQLAYSSPDVRADKRALIEDELVTILKLSRPKTVYIHNLADRHETHLGACLRALAALRRLAPDERPEKVYGMEVWRSLDWTSDGDRLVFDTAKYPDVAEDVLSAFKSQCTPKKRFDTAALGRRLGNATFQAPRDIDPTGSVTIGVDMTALVEDPDADLKAFILDQVDRFRADVGGLLGQLMA